MWASGTNIFANCDAVIGNPEFGHYVPDGVRLCRNEADKGKLYGQERESEKRTHNCRKSSLLRFKERNAFMLFGLASGSIKGSASWTNILPFCLDCQTSSNSVPKNRSPCMHVTFMICEVEQPVLRTCIRLRGFYLKI